jgi:hypothetical protein
VHLSQQIERLTDAYLRAVLSLDEYERRRRDLEQRMQALAGQEELLRNDAQRQQQLAGIAASLETFRARVQHGLAAATFEQRRRLVLLLVDRVVVTNAEVEIRYVLPTSPESEHVRFCHLRKDYFDHPPAGMNGKADLIGWLANDLNGDAGRRRGPVPSIAHVGERLCDEREGAARHPENDRCAIPVLNVGGLGLQDETTPIRIHHHLALAPLHLLGRVVAPRTPALGGFDRLAVDHGGTGRRFAPNPLTVGHDEQVVQPLE